jgi:hypothetical protein
LKVLTLLGLVVRRFKLGCHCLVVKVPRWKQNRPGAPQSVPDTPLLPYSQPLLVSVPSWSCPLLTTACGPHGLASFWRYVS